MINQMFEKIAYESEEYKQMQKEIDQKIMEVFKEYENTLEQEKIIDHIMEVVYQTEKNLFVMGFQYAIRLLEQCNIELKNVDNP